MTAKLVKGTNLNANQRREVLSAFVFRWTIENQNGIFWSREINKPTSELISDNEWINSHAFYIRKDGKLAVKPSHCEPVGLTNPPQHFPL